MMRQDISKNPFFFPEHPRVTWVTRGCVVQQGVSLIFLPENGASHWIRWCNFQGSNEAFAKMGGTPLSLDGANFMENTMDKSMIWGALPFWETSKWGFLPVEFEVHLTFSHTCAVIHLDKILQRIGWCEIWVKSGNRFDFPTCLTMNKQQTWQDTTMPAVSHA